MIHHGVHIESNEGIHWILRLNETFSYQAEVEYQRSGNPSQTLIVDTRIVALSMG